MAEKPSPKNIRTPGGVSGKSSSKDAATLRESERAQPATARDRWVTGLISALFIAASILSLPTDSFEVIPDYNILDPWRHEDMTAEFTFAIQKTAAELNEEQALIRQQNQPVFLVNPNARLQIESGLETLLPQIESILDTYEAWRRSNRSNPQNAASDSLLFASEKANFMVPMSESSWQYLIRTMRTSGAASGAGDAAASGSATSGSAADGGSMAGGAGQTTGPSRSQAAVPYALAHPTLIRLRDALRPQIGRLMEDGVIDLQRQSIESSQIILRDPSERTQRTLSKAGLLDATEAVELLGLRLQEDHSPQLAALAVEIMRYLIVPNWTYSPDDTQQQLQNALQLLSPTKGAIAQGQVIIRRGDIVTRDKAVILDSYADARAERASRGERWIRIGGDVIVVVILIACFLIWLWIYYPQRFLQPRWLGQILLTLGAMLLLNRGIYSLDALSPYVIPLAIAPILITMIIDDRVGTVSNVILAILTGMIHGNSYELATATFIAGYIGILAARDLSNRNRFFVTAPLFIFTGYLLVTVGFSLSHYTGWIPFLGSLGPIAINAILVLITYPLIIFYEKLFGNLTTFSLLELADSNHPLLKRLMDEVPGTFHHSIQVARLAEGAAADIGANPLLVRVGGLYHDIGKMDKPQFFIENQTSVNQHDDIKPNISRMVIREHVKKGVEIAKEYSLHPDIVEFIRTHHGTTLIRYFYDKAVRQTDESEVTEKDYRYPGPKPSTREQGILMLADSVEAAARSQQDKSQAHFKKMIESIVNHYINDGQFQQCPLTFMDLDAIKASFLKTLGGIYHRRVEYPGESPTPAKTHLAD